MQRGEQAQRVSSKPIRAGLNRLGGELLNGSGFETEDPDPLFADQAIVVFPHDQEDAQ
jgi:hypothetical protein